MKRLIYIFMGVAVATTTMLSGCNKWTDPKPVTDPRLTNPYCNDPTAVNYNWGFPGKPDNTICFYPTDLFKGNFVFNDLVFSLSGSNAGLFIDSLTDTLHVYALSQTKLVITGFCKFADTIHLTASGFVATVDTLIGDTLTARGQFMFCRMQDTVSGTITYSRADSLLHIALTVVSDTGSTTHSGKAKRQ
jgi:hypothetical protein